MRTRTLPRGGTPRSLSAWWIAAILIALLLAACSSGPEPIAYDRDSCAFCRMQISDPRYGGELITRTGKVHKFDSIECLASFYAGLQDSAAVRSLWVSDFRKPGTLLPAQQALYIHHGGAGSPMGRGLLALKAGSNTLAGVPAGDTLSWSDVVGLVAVPLAAQRPLVVSPDGPVRSLTEAVRRASPNDTILVSAGTYREPTIIVDKPLTIRGIGLPLLDGEGQRQIMTIAADDVTVRGLHFMHVGTSYVEDRAAIKVAGASRCTISDNRFDDAFFGIYLAEATDCVVARNELHASTLGEVGSGNGIHLWSSRGITIADNRITGHRDGIYLEFSHESEIRGNVSERNVRYGLHFMYSNDCRYTHNVFRENGSGVAVMYTKNVTMTGNRFEHNWGGAAYGLLLKEITDSRLEGNVFERNTTGLLAEGANRLQVDRNEFISNGWALKLEASTMDGRFTRNNFIGNTFDVITNSRQNTSTFTGNFWDDYSGYDLDRDGVGDVPYWPVRLFSLLAARAEPALVLLHSAFVELLDAAERVAPVLTPNTVNDPRPAMRRIT